MRQRAVVAHRVVSILVLLDHALPAGSTFREYRLQACQSKEHIVSDPLFSWITLVGPLQRRKTARFLCRDPHARFDPCSPGSRTSATNAGRATTNPVASCGCSILVLLDHGLVGGPHGLHSRLGDGGSVFDPCSPGSQPRRQRSEVVRSRPLFWVFRSLVLLDHARRRCGYGRSADDTPLGSTLVMCFDPCSPGSPSSARPRNHILGWAARVSILVLLDHARRQRSTTPEAILEPSEDVSILVLLDHALQGVRSC